MAISDVKVLAAMWGAPRPKRPPAATEPDPAQSPDLPYDLAQQTLQRQLDAADSLDQKTTNAFTGAVALVALVAAVFALREDSLKGWNAAWFFASLVPLAII